MRGAGRGSVATGTTHSFRGAEGRGSSYPLPARQTKAMAARSALAGEGTYAQQEFGVVLTFTLRASFSAASTQLVPVGPVNCIL